MHIHSLRAIMYIPMYIKLCKSLNYSCLPNQLCKFKSSFSHEPLTLDHKFKPGTLVILQALKTKQIVHEIPKHQKKGVPLGFH